MCDNFESSAINNKMVEDIKFANSLINDPKYELKLKNQITYKSSFFTQFYWLMWRSFLSMFRDPFSTKISIFQTIVRLNILLLKNVS